MPYKWFLSILVLSFATSAFAATPLKKQGNCARITGSWYGTFTLKDAQECRLYHGCTHSLTIHVNHINSTNYQADVTPQVGKHGSFPIYCLDEKITSPSHPGSTIVLECPDRTICTVKYNDDKQSASLIGAGID